jgi:hypothetical protein
MPTDIDPLDDEPLSEEVAERFKRYNPFYLGEPRPIGEFQANLQEQLDRLHETKWSQLLTAEDGREFVLQSAEGYRELLKRLDYAETVVAIEQGREAVRRGDTLPLDEAFQKIRDGTWRDDGARR